MKFIIVLLGVANLSALLFFSTRPVPLDFPQVQPSQTASRLVLISEISADELAEKSLPEPSQRRCFAVGPLASKAQTQRLKAWVTTLAPGVSSQVITRHESNRHWVHLPPAASLTEALSAESALRAKGIGDVHVIRRGDMKHAVSLGLYSLANSARRRVAQLNALGVEPEVAKRPGGRKHEWLEVRFQTDRAFPNVQLAALFTEIRSVSAPCH